MTQRKIVWTSVKPSEEDDAEEVRRMLAGQARPPQPSYLIIHEWWVPLLVLRAGHHLFDKQKTRHHPATLNMLRAWKACEDLNWKKLGREMLRKFHVADQNDTLELDFFNMIAPAIDEFTDNLGNEFGEFHRLKNDLRKRGVILANAELTLKQARLVALGQLKATPELAEQLSREVRFIGHM